MKTLTKLLLAVVTVCLCLSVGALPSGKTKPFQIWGHSEGIITGGGYDSEKGLLYITTEEVDIGITTFAGRHYNLCYGTYYVDGYSEMYGYWTGANEKGSTDWTATGGGGTAQVTITQGYGIMAGASGYFNSKVSNLIIDYEAGTISYDYKGSGYMTFPEK